jgi:hypothetical protein
MSKMIMQKLSNETMILLVCAIVIMIACSVRSNQEGCEVKFD